MSGDVPSLLRRGGRPALLAVVAPLVLAGCGGREDVLHPHTHAAHKIALLWWVMMTGAWIGFGVIAVLLFLGWARRNRDGLPFGRDAERTGTALVIALGVAVPIVFLSALFVWADIFAIRSTDAPRVSSTSLTVKVVGHQWFWEVLYPGSKAVTANEIHIPLSTRVDVVGTTADVIHSLWVPELNRKIDLVPGRANRMLWDTSTPGRYEGRCAEFCGLQHAHMSVYVVAQPVVQFRAWLQDMARPARTPTTALEGEGLKVFLSHACADCHQIRGTPAVGQIGPDLTHLMSRQTLAAGAIPNTRDELANWIIDPQHVKPGNKMPALNLSGRDLDAVLAYLRSLK